MLVGSREKTSAADNLPAQTIVVFNAAVPDAESLANFTRKNAESPTITSSSSIARGRTSHEQARCAYTKRDDIIRCVSEECDSFIKFGKPSCALDLTRRVLRIVPESPAVQLLHKRESDLTPQPPPPPPHYSGRPDRIMPRSLFSMNSSSWLISSRGSISFRTASIAWRVFSFDR